MIPSLTRRDALSRLGGGFGGLILGSLLTFWIGEETLRAIQRGFRRLTGGDDRPNFEMLLQ